jgi:hypothetical protein
MELLTMEKNATEVPNVIPTACSCVETELLKLERNVITEPRILMKSPTSAEPIANSPTVVMESEMPMRNVIQELQTLMPARTAELLVETEGLMLESNVTTDAIMMTDFQTPAEPPASKLIVVMVSLIPGSNVMMESGIQTPQTLVVLAANFQDVVIVLLTWVSSVIPVQVVHLTARNSVEMVVLMLVNSVIMD